MKKILVMVLVIMSLLLFASCGKSDSCKIEFTIPAGNSETFIFSDQEISPIGNEITLSTDTEAVVKFSQIREEDSYELITESLAQGTMIEIPLEKNTWYKIGLTVENPSEEDIVVSVEINGAQMRAE